VGHGVLAEGGGEVDRPGAAERADDQVAQAGMTCGPGAQLGGVLGEGHVPDVVLWVSVRTGPAGAPSAGSRLSLLGAAMTSTLAPGAGNGARPLHDPLSGGRSFSLRMH
jgi:hypothetical protein